VHTLAVAHTLAVVHTALAFAPAARNTVVHSVRTVAASLLSILFQLTFPVSIKG